MIDCTSAGAIALITNCAGLSDHSTVDAFAVELVRHRLHARAAHADAGADRIGAGVVSDHRDLGAIARIAGAGLDLDQALADFRHFELEQLHHEFRRCAADEQLRAAGLAAHVVEITADAVAGAHHVAGDRPVFRDEGFGIAAQIDVNVAALDALDYAGDQLADAVLPGVDDLITLGFAHALHDHLLRGLGRDAAEFGVLDLLFDVVADFDAFDFVDRVHQPDLTVGRLHDHVVGHDFPAAEGFVTAVFRIDRDSREHVLILVTLLRRSGERGLQGLDDHRFRHAFFVGDRIDDKQEFLTHSLDL
jgi:hypothetical protein